MARTNTIQTPELFPVEVPQVEEQAPEQGRGDTWAELLELAHETKQQYEQAGKYYLLPPDSLLQRGEQFYTANADAVRDLLIQGVQAGKIEPDTVNAVLYDYACIFGGVFDFRVTPKQMIQTLSYVRPYSAYFIDKDGFYFALLLSYSRYVRDIFDYQNRVSGETATAETRTDYFNTELTIDNARAFEYIRRSGLSKLEDFRDVGRDVMVSFIDKVAAAADVGTYALYYYIAKFCLSATPEELQAIPRPLSERDAKRVQEWAENNAATAERKLRETARTFSDAMNPENTEAQAEAQREAADWKSPTNTAPVELHEIPNIICSRPVKAIPHGAKITAAQVAAALPLQRFIDDFKKRNPEYLDVEINSTSVQKVFEGINYLPYAFRATEHSTDGQFTYKFNISEFANICGYADANQREKLALYGSLLMLNNLYVVVERPIRLIKNSKGFTRQTGGLTAVRVLSIREYGLNTGNIILDVNPKAMKGKPTLLTAEDYKKLREQAKGLTQSRFNAQILSKGHKALDDMVNEIFGLNELISEAEKSRNPEELKTAKKYVQGHKSDFKKKVLKWFEDYQTEGLLTYEKNLSTDGRIIMEWKRTKPLIPDGSEPLPQEPDEQ